MLATITFIAGLFIGAVVGVTAIAITAARRTDRIALVEKANARLLGDLATACERNVEMARDLAEAKSERDAWRKETMKDGSWQDTLPGEAV